MRQAPARCLRRGRAASCPCHGRCRRRSSSAHLARIASRRSLMRSWRAVATMRRMTRRMRRMRMGRRRGVMARRRTRAPRGQLQLPARVRRPSRAAAGGRGPGKATASTPVHCFPSSSEAQQRCAWMLMVLTASCACCRMGRLVACGKHCKRTRCSALRCCRTRGSDQPFCSGCPLHDSLPSTSTQ